MGPSALAPLEVVSGAVTTLLSGTQVTFDGLPAPMIYTLDRQVSAVVPYGVANRRSTDVQVIYNGQKSNVVTMPVQGAHPGIFTLDASGTGPGAILNQDLSINTPQRTLRRGAASSPST